MKQKIIYTKGLIASGKSTYALELCKNDKTFRRVNRDHFREMLNDYAFDKETESIINKLEFDTIITLLQLGYNIIVDRMNLNQKRLDEEIIKIKEELPFNEFDIEIVEFPITLYQAIERDSKRSRSFGKSVIKRVWDSYEVELKQMVERHKPKQIIDENLPWCVICDIDGSLSDSTNRKIFDDSKAHEDIVIEPVKFILRMLETYYNAHCCDDFNQIRIFIMSGRQESCKKITETWLYQTNISYDNIFMRTTGDSRPDTVVKKELYEKHIKGKYNVKFVIDDRKSVCQQWVDMGLFVFDVSQDPLAKNIF